jgi:hypothetical protein
MRVSRGRAAHQLCNIKCLAVACAGGTLPIAPAIRPPAPSIAPSALSRCSPSALSRSSPPPFPRRLSWRIHSVCVRPPSRSPPPASPPSQRRSPAGPRWSPGSTPSPDPRLPGSAPSGWWPPSCAGRTPCSALQQLGVLPARPGRRGAAPTRSGPRGDARATGADDLWQWLPAAAAPLDRRAHLPVQRHLPDVRPPRRPGPATELGFNPAKGLFIVLPRQQ